MEGTAPVRAIVYVHRGPVSRAKQEAAVYAHCTARGYQMVGLCQDAPDCAGLVADRAAELVVAAYDPRNGLAELVCAAGGRIEFTRRTPARVTVAALARRWRSRGKSVREIADLLDSTTGEVRAMLLRERDEDGTTPRSR